MSKVVPPIRAARLYLQLYKWASPALTVRPCPCPAAPGSAPRPRSSVRGAGAGAGGAGGHQGCARGPPPPPARPAPLPGPCAPRAPPSGAPTPPRPPPPTPPSPPPKLAARGEGCPGSGPEGGSVPLPAGPSRRRPRRRPHATLGAQPARGGCPSFFTRARGTLWGGSRGRPGKRGPSPASLPRPPLADPPTASGRPTD